ncbi:SEC7-like protein [Daedalea quercina L-15889]|uniref:SEC7-like protein n=1 Tax=Daedalea quercina L-15889 TaxID=1314783 RepID=A0A165U0F2_9APHY|nr:SEC7-like protein [Daedalea quercina L-15889]
MAICTVAIVKPHKKLVLTGTARFNAKLKMGISFLKEHEHIYTDPDEPRSLSLARFLKNSARMDKRLRTFTSLLDFKDEFVAEAMRELLETFRLPGSESQQINRIVESFSEIYFATGHAEAKSQHAVYVLAYSIIILLNSDQRRTKYEMTINDYKLNLQGVSDASDSRKSIWYASM